MRRILLITVFLLLSCSSLYASPILDISPIPPCPLPGCPPADPTLYLFGASGVDVGGVLYDVSFGLSIHPSPFSTAEQALLASQALMDQVFTGMFDTEPRLVIGCSGDGNRHPNNPDCRVFTVFEQHFDPTAPPGTGLLMSVGIAYNHELEERDGIGTATDLVALEAFYDIGGYTQTSWRQVSEPESIVLLLIGLVPMFIAWRKNRRPHRQPDNSPR